MNLKNIFTAATCLGLAINVNAQMTAPQGNDTYNSDFKNHQVNRYHKPNILALAPIQFTENGVAGVSVSYEHAIDERSIVAFYLPAILEFNLSNTENTGNTNGNSDPMFYLMPGIKIYPTGGFGPMTKYAIGPSLVIADGQRTVSDANYNGYQVQDHFVLGMLINQSVNISPAPWFYLGCEFGFGFSYIDKVGGLTQGVQELVNFNFKIGFRY